MDNRDSTPLDCLSPHARGGVLTIGNFDGVHLGHQEILRVARGLADAEGGQVVAMTFEPPPDLVLRPADAPQRVVPPDQRARLLRQAGADLVVVAQADQRLLGLTPPAFIDEIIVGRFAPRHVVEGSSFRFGRGRAGDVEALVQAGRTAGFAVHVVQPVRLELGDGEQVVSSTLIRRLVAAGRIEDAARCLGRAFILYGNVVAGKRRGRALEFPTANLLPGEQICPADGVYAGRATVGGRTYLAAVSVGAQPTFHGGAGERIVEAFLLDAAGDFYDEYMALEFVRRLRDQERFGDAESLKAQIARDVERVREICG